MEQLQKDISDTAVADKAHFDKEKDEANSRIKELERQLAESQAQSQFEAQAAAVRDALGTAKEGILAAERAMAKAPAPAREEEVRVAAAELAPYLKGPLRLRF